MKFHGLYLFPFVHLKKITIKNIEFDNISNKNFFLRRRKLATCIGNILIRTCLHGSEDVYFQVNFGQQFQSGVSHCIGWTHFIFIFTFISLLQPPKLASKGLTPKRSWIHLNLDISSYEKGLITKFWTWFL